MHKPKKLDAIDVLNWDHLLKIGEYLDADSAHTPDQALRAFAYAFVSTASEEGRNAMFSDILRNATFAQSEETNERFIEWLASKLRCDIAQVRRYAKENGVRLKKG
jgi:hypothetical protein